jgi:glycosyltransferase involved in cell wall biosynthesis
MVQMTTIDIVVPVYNEERALPESIPTLSKYLESAAFPYDWQIIIGDNASTDDTPGAGKQIEDASRGKVRYVRIERKGRGYALKQIWGASEADIVSYMDVDLSTGITAFPDLIRAITDRGFDIAIGSRLAAGAQVTRSLKRRVLTRGYNTIIKATFLTRFSDAQCGFKAVRTDVFKRIVPLVEDNNWFFDTELLIVAEKMGYRVADVPVEWVEDTDSRVKIAATVSEDLKGLFRLFVNRPWRSAGRPASTTD